MKDNQNKFIFIAGPCVIENRSMVLDIASFLTKIVKDYPIDFVFKASFDKANRTSADSFRGVGIEKGLAILGEVKKKFKVKVLSDVHEVSQVKQAAKVLDVIQIPAFLCRQTDLLVAAAKTKRIVNIKKGQFVAPQDMSYAVRKVLACDNKNVWLTERGTSFGYGNLVVDFRSFLIMKQIGCPVIFDATHSLQRPSAANGISGGDRQFIEPMVLAATACGIDGLFMETHPNPDKAKSDKHTVYKLSDLPDLLKKVFAVKQSLR